MPRKKQQEWPRDIAIVFLLCLAAFVLLQNALLKFPWHYDEGVSLYGAVRILKGQVPYRDFFHITTPGAAFLLALVYGVAGVGVLQARLVMAFSGFAFIILLFLFSKKLVKNPLLSAIPPLLFLLLDMFPNMDYSTHRLAVFFAMIGLMPLVAARKRKGHIYAGLLGGLAFFMNQNIGAFSLLGLGLLALIKPFFFRERTWLRSGASDLLSLAIGALLALVPLVIYLFIFGALNEFLYDTFIWAMKWYRNFNQYPYFSFEIARILENLQKIYEGHATPMNLGDTSFFILTGFLPLLLYPVSLFASFLRREWTGCSLSLMGVCLFISSSNHPDNIHVLRSLIPLYPLLVFIPFLLFGKIRTGHHLAWLPLVPLILLPAFSCFDMYLYLGTPQAMPSFPVKTERGVLYSPSEIEARVMENVIARVTAATGRNDPVFFYHWAPALYFLCNRDNPTMFDTYKPLYTTPEQLRALRSQLERSRPEIVVKDNYIDSFYDPNKRISTTFPMVDRKRLRTEDEVDHWILKNYRPKEKINIYTILVPALIEKRT